MPQSIATTFDYKSSNPYFKALTTARPDDSWALWFRLPDSLEQALNVEDKDYLISEIKKALDNPSETKKIIKEVFTFLILKLETWFTKKQVLDIVDNYDKFTDDFIVPIEDLEDNTYLLNESYWPTDAFKDLALQLVTSMVSIIVEIENKQAIEKAKEWEKWQTLRFIITQTSTSWDTWPAWWSWIEWKNFVLNVIWYPENEATYAQKWQMINLTWNVKSISMNTSFSKIQESMLAWNTQDFKGDLQDILEDEFKDLIEEYWFKIVIDSGSFNSINPWRVDGQTIYHAYWLLQAQAREIVGKDEEIIEVIPSWNWWHMYSLLMARLMTHEKWKTIITCNRNNMFYKIIEEGVFKKPWSNTAIDEPSVSMIIEYPNNMIRLFSYAFWPERAKEITTIFFNDEEVRFSNEERNILKDKLWLVWVEVSWTEELVTIWETFEKLWRLVCPHTANAIAWLKKYREDSWDSISKALVSETASPWKFLAAVAAGLSYKDTTDLEWLYKKYKQLENTREWALELIEIIKNKYTTYWKIFSLDLIPANLREIYKAWYKNNQVVGPEQFQTQTIDFLKDQAPIFRKQILTLIK